MGRITYGDGTTPRICIVGAGFSGLTAGIELKRKLNLETFKIYELHGDVGGVWLTHTYPGCACDVPSHLYSWSFELNPEWSHTYAYRDDIHTYMRRTAEKYDLLSHLEFNTEVKSLTWNEEAKYWTVTILRKEQTEEETLIFDIVINCTGILHFPDYPKVFQGFKGPVLHAGEWDHSVDLENKVVAVIGNGASAIQIIPAVASKVKELHCYQRKAPWIRHRPQATISERTKWLFERFPLLMWLWRLFLFCIYEAFHWTFETGSWANQWLLTSTTEHLDSELTNHAQLKEKAMPDYLPGCKRVLFHDEYYPTLKLPHVQLHMDRIDRVTEKSIITADGHSQHIDVVILATGFEYQDFFRQLKIVGNGPTDLVSIWKEDHPSTYLGIMSSHAPNHFICLGPNTILGHSSVIFMIECQAGLIVKLIEEMMCRGSTSVKPRASVEKNYMAGIRKDLAGKVWSTEDCNNSMYVNSKGDVTFLYPNKCVSYWSQTRSLDTTKFEFN